MYVTITIIIVIIIEEAAVAIISSARSADGKRFDDVGGLEEQLWPSFWTRVTFTLWYSCCLTHTHTGGCVGAET